jgi:hypothetical protein
MRPLVLIIFGMWVVGALIKMGRLVICDYPRINKISLGEDCAALVESVAFALVAAYLLWG